jgi:hypothetical protein
MSSRIQVAGKKNLEQVTVLESAGVYRLNGKGGLSSIIAQV